jgi:hypothetical protein
MYKNLAAIVVAWAATVREISGFATALPLLAAP